MAQITTGLRKLLSLPAFYNSFSKILGAEDSRRFFAERYVSADGNSKILDIGCGTSEILTYLPKDVEYIGYDLSETYIDAARARFGNRGKWFCAPVSLMNVEEFGTFDIVIATGILHHLDDSEAIRLIEVAFSALKPHGRFVCLENAYTEDQSALSRLIVSQDRGQNVRTPDGYALLFRAYFSNINLNIHHNLLRVPYTHVIFIATKEKR